MSAPWIERRVIGDATLYLGDALEVLPRLTWVGAIIADPPYAIPTQVASGRKVVRNVGDLSMIEVAFREYARTWKALLGETGRCFVFCDGASYPVIYRALYSYFNLASLVWDKGQIGMGREFRKRHELLVHAWGAETPVCASDGVGFADVICRPPVPVSDRIHPAQKPVALICDLLRVCRGTVVDPFMGSGATGIACAQTRQQFIGIENDSEYFAAACRRIDEAQCQGQLFQEALPRPVQLALVP